MSNEYCVILTAVGSDSQAETIASMLVEERLAACVQVMPISSYYTWQGKLNRDAEWLLLIKTRADRYTEIEGAIIEYHTYGIPEIIKLPVIDGLGSYLRWIDECLS